MQKNELMARARDVMTDHKAPYPGLIMDLVINPEYHGVLFIRVYRDNVESFSERQKDELGAYLVALRARVEKHVIPYQVVLEGVETDPGHNVSRPNSR